MLTAHFEYPNRTAVGLAIIIIEEITPPVSPYRTPLYNQHGFADLCWYLATDGLRRSPAAVLPPLPDFKVLKTNNSDAAWEESKVPGPLGLYARC
ncbi:hypothetical protein F4814DRAFT_448899 [Daldinia grandis]|nr:hypothetical protein F4814DRAFT_448899 [Daldinia grandis]